jgi:hypothetical protein
MLRRHSVLVVLVLVLVIARVFDYDYDDEDDDGRIPVMAARDLGGIDWIELDAALPERAMAGIAIDSCAQVRGEN